MTFYFPRQLFFAFFKTVPLWLALLAHAHSQAETHALLVGVSGYPALPEARRLRGPANDVQLMRAALLAHGVQNAKVVTLADGVVGSQALPTRANIMQGLVDLAIRAQAGDWAVVYFSGHGSQQPQPPAASLPAGTYIEPDGLDEIFLPYDVGQWSGSKGRVEGAIVDDEIGAALAKLTQRGIKVWAVFDTCHAGDMAKGGDLFSTPVNRFVTPSQLGIPAQGPQKNGARQLVQAQANAKTNPNQGELVIFYASQPEEPAAEEPLAVPALLNAKADSSAASATTPKRYFGLFTYLIADALPQWRGNFGQLAQQVALKYKTRPYPTPMFVGNLKLNPQLAQIQLGQK